jgi:putative heme-binding domain-containing protein
VLGQLKPSPRVDVVETYRDVLDMEGESERGRLAFRKICAACHRAEGQGHEIGPNLATMQNRGAETILVNVLDPNREVDPKYVSYLVATEDGRTLTGMIAAETATSITLKRAENATDVVLRIDVEHLQSSRQSIMPEGLEKQLDKQALADVIAYLLSLK